MDVHQDEAQKLTLTISQAIGEAIGVGAAVRRHYSNDEQNCCSHISSCVLLEKLWCLITADMAMLVSVVTPLPHGH